MLRYPDFPNIKFPEKSKVQNLKHEHNYNYVAQGNVFERCYRYIPKDRFLHAHAESGRRKCAFSRAHACMRRVPSPIRDWNLTVQYPYLLSRKSALMF